MRNFLRLSTDLPVAALMEELACQPELWNQFPVRTSHPRSAHRVVDDIILRYSPFDSGDDFVEKVCAEIACVDYPAWYKLPAAHQFIFGLMAGRRGVHLGRCMVARLPPGICIPPHTDVIPEADQQFPLKPAPARYYDRYHVVLASAPGVVFRCGDETVYMATGEAWWFNNELEHEVVNNSGEDRLHLIVDIRTAHDDYVPS